MFKEHGWELVPKTVSLITDSVHWLLGALLARNGRTELKRPGFRSAYLTPNV